MTTAVSSKTVSEDMARSRDLARQFLSDPQRLAISFRLDGRPISGIPADWNPSARRRRLDATLVLTDFEGREPQSGLVVRVECLEYLDYPVVEWTAWFTNTGSAPTPIISDLLALDGAFQGASPVLWHSNGDLCGLEGYQALESPVREGDSLPFAATGGKPCRKAFPYFRLTFEGGGLSLAIGWPGQWSASFTGAAGGVRVTAGQAKTRLRLMPGETIRTPRMTVLSWTGDAARAANLWRRWYRTHVMPKPDGQPMRPLLAAHGTDEGSEFTAATEENQVRYIEKWVERGIPIDVWWIDAGWYPCYSQEHRREWEITGTWEPDPERFPRGLKPVSNRAAGHGADLLLWFEPERVTAGTRLDRERPEWLLRLDAKKYPAPQAGSPPANRPGFPPGTSSDWRLLNLGDPACRRWLTDHVCELIRTNGINIYRQDFNFAPLHYWRDNEPEDRQGVNENLYVQGYLQYWDDLLGRNPGLWIDSCASGGTRNDLETMRRSVPLHYSDSAYGNHPEKLSFQHVLFEWLPYFKEFTHSWDLEAPARYDRRVDRFSYHCGLGPMMMPCIDIRRDDYDYELMKKMLGIWRRAAELMLNGDYYPLTPIHRSPEKWVARQFDCPEEGRGFIQGIRPPACPDETLVVHPHGLGPEGEYVFENAETGESRVLTGATIQRKGFALSVPKREGAIWFYRAKEST